MAISYIANDGFIDNIEEYHYSKDLLQAIIKMTNSVRRLVNINMRYELNNTDILSNRYGFYLDYLSKANMHF